MTKDNQNYVLRAPQAADWLGISLSTFYKRVKQGLIPPATYRQGNSAAWHTIDLNLTTPTKEGKTMYVTDTRLVAPHVLEDLLVGETISHASFTENYQHGANTTMNLVAACLKKEYGVNVKYTRKGDGGWFMDSLDIIQFKRSPALHRHLTQEAAKKRSEKLFERKIEKLVNENRYLVIKELNKNYLSDQLQ